MYQLQGATARGHMVPSHLQQCITAAFQCIARVGHLHLAVASVNDIQDAIHSQRRLCNVGGHDALARTLRRLVENLGLQVGRQLGVDGQDQQGRHLFP